jgi:hypothetical protein
MRYSKHILVLTAAGAAFAAQAESSFGTAPAGGGSTSTRLEFRIVIPQVLFLRVGSEAHTANASGFNALVANASAGRTAALPPGVSAYPPNTRILGNGHVPYTVALP